VQSRGEAPPIDPFEELERALAAKSAAREAKSRT